MGYRVTSWYMHKTCNDWIKVTSITIISNIYYLFCLFVRQNLTLSPKLEYSGAILAHCNLRLSGSSNSHTSTSASRASGITDICHHIWLIFVFLVETGFHHLGQAGLKLPTSGDPPTLASQSAGVTGMSHRSRPSHIFFSILWFRWQRLVSKGLSLEWQPHGKERMCLFG